ncbi:MAG: hypothetical protein WAN65_31860, partial [Candidatus Sulfotelmatobacter sp.]
SNSRGNWSRRPDFGLARGISKFEAVSETGESLSCRLFINTPLQRGGPQRWCEYIRFSGFSRPEKPLKRDVCKRLFF